MSVFADYSRKYRNIYFERRDGILLVRLHTNDGPLKWGFKDDASVHAALGDAFFNISRDPENKIVILTGTGSAFLEETDPNELIDGAIDANEWDRIYKESKDLIMNLLNIDVPIIGAVNGPALFHAELVAMSDIVLASDTAVFADLIHFPYGAVPGDGSHVFWQMLLGPNRGRAFMLMGTEIRAQEALSLGFVAEVLPPDQLLARAWEIAEELIKKPRLTLRYSRVCLTQHIKVRMMEELGYGLTLEGLSAIS